MFASSESMLTLIISVIILMQFTLNVPAVSVERLTDPSFEIWEDSTHLDHWTEYGINRDNNPVYSGSYSVILNGANDYVYQTFTLGGEDINQIGVRWRGDSATSRVNIAMTYNGGITNVQCVDSEDTWSYCEFPTDYLYDGKTYTEIRFTMFFDKIWIDAATVTSADE